MKYLIVTISLLAFVSCKDSSNKNNKKSENVEQAFEAEEEHHNDEATDIYENAWTSEIVMNNGEKWEANSETNEGVEKMKNSINTQSTTTLDDYHKLAEMLNDDKNFVIKNCTMKGASHDNLHVWLLPLISKIEALSEVKTIKDAAKIKHSINENIGA